MAADVDLSQNSHPKLVDLEHNGMVQTQEQSTMRVLPYPSHTFNKSATTVNYQWGACLQLNTPINACKGGLSLRFGCYEPDNMWGASEEQWHETDITEYLESVDISFPSTHQV